MRACVAALALALVACGRAPGAGGADAGPDAGAEAAAVDRLRKLLSAEHRRVATEVTAEDQQSRDLRVRRAAARTLARVGGEAARGGLLRALSDEDDEVVSWAAHGLGFSCEGGKGAPRETVTALVARALARGDEPVAPAISAAAPDRPAASASAAGSAAASAAASSARPEFSPIVAIARAIGRCAAEESEPTLVAWLGGPRERAAAAAYGLGELAIGKKKLREETLVALLNLAAGSASSPPLADALFPVGRLENVPSTVVDRIREVAAARLAERAEARMFAIRALGRAGLDAGPELGRVISSPEQFSAAERAEAARMAKRLKAAGERALVEALPKLAPPTDPLAMTGLVGEELGVLLTVLESLDGWKPDGPGSKTLRDLASLASPSGAPAALSRRVTHIRCAAAKLLAVANWREPLLVSCDAGEPAAAVPAPDSGAPSAASKLAGGSIGLRAVVAVLGRAEITGPRLQAWRSIALTGELRAREAALELLEAHAEIDAADVLAQALSSELDGVVATAAEVIAKQPQRASVSSRKATKGKRKKDKPGDKPGDKPDAVVSEPSPAIAKALLARLAAASELKDAEVLASVVDAAGALALKEATPPLEALCASSWPTLRAHAAKALDAIGGKKGKTCEPPAGGGPAPRELDGLVAGVTGGVVTLVFDSDVGELTLALDAGIAPVTVTRIVQLARAGYYDGMVVHRVVPGFVTQFGAPHGDGFGGPPDRPPLRCETSPLPFGALAVGVALAGRDTGSSQLFVMHARHPHLDGGYAWVGSATGPWSAFVDGDRITKARIRP